MGPDYTVRLQAILVEILMGQGRTQEAQNEARAGCADPSLNDVHGELVKAGLCGENKDSVAR